MHLKYLSLIISVNHFIDDTTTIKRETSLVVSRSLIFILNKVGPSKQPLRTTVVTLTSSDQPILVCCLCPLEIVQYKYSLNHSINDTIYYRQTKISLLARSLINMLDKVGTSNQSLGIADATLTSSDQPILVSCLCPLEIFQYKYFSSLLHRRYNPLQIDKHFFSFQVIDRHVK